MAQATVERAEERVPLNREALPLTGPTPVADVGGPMIQQFSDGGHPHLVEMATEHVLQPGSNFGNEFEIGLNVDALARWIPENFNPRIGSGMSVPANIWAG